MKNILFILIGFTSFTFATLSEVNGIVTDDVTGLQWQKVFDQTTKDWHSAINYCNGLTLGVYEDWRLPNIRELQSLVDKTSTKPAISDVLSIDIALGVFWSSSTDYQHKLNGIEEKVYAWTVNFAFGNMSFSLKDNDSSYVRCVRN